MLSPEYLNLIEFNDVVELYNKLNIDITVDIINRVAQMQDIIPSTKHQLAILKQTNGLEIFNKALEETSMLTVETKKALKLLFEDMAKEDIEGYKELYEYRDKPFKLSENQYKILNQGLRTTNNILKNFTNTIAFQSQQAYVEAVDKAYFKVASGAFDYATAIHTACQELAEKGITLKDKLGRKVQLEVAVRRNVMTGIQQTANNINRDIEEYLGCDGYEVTAHMGARPTHAEAQGKQYAISKENAGKYGIELWSDVVDLWSEYNCRHSYFGIVLGISEPVYTDKELKEFREATVEWNGKKIPHYEATQKQRQFENAIRKQKREVQTLEKANMDNKVEKGQLAQLQKKYKDFCKETGLEKDYQRLQVAKNNSTSDNKKWYNKLGNSSKNSIGGNGKGQFIEKIARSQVKQKLNEYEEDIRNMPIEYGVLIDIKGEVYAYTGDKYNLSISDRSLEGVILTHNHPEIGSFGKDDYDLLKENKNIKELRAVDGEYTYSLKLKKPLDMSYTDIYRQSGDIMLNTKEENQHCVMLKLKELGYIKYVRKRKEK